jgi:hypothetical protein
VKRAAIRNSQSQFGSARITRSPGVIHVVTSRARAVMTTAKSPRVEKRRRPKIATRAGRTMRLTTTKTRPR